MSVKINRDTIQFVKTFYVAITTREFSGDPTTLTGDQSIATPNIGMIIILGISDNSNCY